MKIGNFTIGVGRGGFVVNRDVPGYGSRFWAINFNPRGLFTFCNVRNPNVSNVRIFSAFIVGSVGRCAK